MTKRKTADEAPATVKESFKDRIFIKGARANNLKNIDLEIPKNRLVVVTGVSGSGKSSITMDTLFAEGQRRYVESLSAYARQFLMRMKKPDVDYIKGICPAIAIEQRVSTANARSTVGTLTEVYDFLRLLFARVGRTYSPVSGKEVKKHQVSDVTDFIQRFPEGTKVQLYIPLPFKYGDRIFGAELNLLLQKGYTRFRYEGQLQMIQDLLESDAKILSQKLAELRESDIRILIDRFAVSHSDSEHQKRIGDSVQTAFSESEGDCFVMVDDGEAVHFSSRFELDGLSFPEPTPQLFNFNNSMGACPVCEGFSMVMGIEEDKVIPDKTLSVYQGAVACWKGEKFGQWLEQFLLVAHHFDFPVHRAYQDLSKAQRDLLWSGHKLFPGIHSFFEELEQNTYKIQNRVMLARYRGRTLCRNCGGGRLRPEALNVRIGGKSIADLTVMPVGELPDFFKTLSFNAFESQVGKRLLLEIMNRLNSMNDLGLGYLTLNRLSSTLSGGEIQRIHLTRTLGSNLTSSMYLLDEPSVGLHPRDTSRLIKVLKTLRDLGNTVVVVEHEEEVIRNCDFLVDIGPQAGIFGGEVVFAGPFKDIYSKAAGSLTTMYMNGQMEIAVPEIRRSISSYIEIQGARQNNLKNIQVRIPLQTLTVVSGVSGSGKTTLVRDILHPALLRQLGQPSSRVPGAHSAIAGDWKSIKGVEMVNQSPIGKSSRSNPVTYVKAYDNIRDLMSNQQLSKIRGFKPRHFSFNVEGGRCEHCKGEGEIVVEMQFLADVHLECEECRGRRFKEEVLDVRYKEKNIHQILDLSVDEALLFFSEARDVVQKLQPLSDVGLGYVKLGQSSSTLSGGEAQRVKLASFLVKDQVAEGMLFIFDEPTTGLHFHDISKLLVALNALVEKGHTVLVVEHNLEVIKSADWVIDLGPEGGDAGGNLVYQGRPEGLAAVAASHTGQFLKGKVK